MLNEERRIEEVAFLRAKGKKITAISGMLQLPYATVDSLLRKAEGKGLYREIVEFDSKQISTERMKQLRLLDYVESLRDRLRGAAVNPLHPEKSLFQQVHVFDSGSVNETPQGMKTRLTRFGFEAAPCLAEFIYQAHEVGVAYGTTLSSVIRSLDSGRFPNLRNHKRVRFIPTCGEPFGSSLRADSSSLLAAELDERCNGENRERLSLSGIPAVLPKEFADSGEDAIVRRFLQHSKTYRRIFGPAEEENGPLIDKLETVLTSAGASEWHWRMCGVELCEIGGIDRALFENLALGDLGGVLIPRSEYPPPERLELLNKIAALWTGITLDQYRNITLKGDSHRGVVVIAIGSNKARLVYRAIKAGVVNHLICDQALAWALCKECGALSPDEVL